MKITASGQISLPADVRQRWEVKRVRLIDHGDHVEVHPLPDHVVAATVGAFASKSKRRPKPVRKQKA
jgi:bifunctional DNA-binding transcriptional regulator/antitoxin component of YhaV-PrlF toxin-antitoxin module